MRASTGSFCSSALSQQSIQPSYAVDNAYDLNPIGQRAIRDEKVAGQERAKLGGDRGASTGEEGVAGEEHTLVVDLLEQPVGGVRVVHSDGAPDIDQIILGPSTRS